jgi:large subunit ribosomal protein L21
MGEAYEGDIVELDKVMLIADDDDNITVGSPVIDGARVTATCQGEKRADKIIVFHYKPKTRYQKKNGHRQRYTRLLINDIIEPGAKEATPKRTRRRKTEETEEVTEDGA